jgi:hypothetical protein
MMTSQVCRTVHARGPIRLETAGETKGAPGASAKAEGDKYPALRQKYTQLKLDHAARGKCMSELETETSRLGRELRKRSEYGATPSSWGT